MNIKFEQNAPATRCLAALLAQSKKYETCSELKTFSFCWSLQKFFSFQFLFLSYYCFLAWFSLLLFSKFNSERIQAQNLPLEMFVHYSNTTQILIIINTFELIKLAGLQELCWEKLFIGVPLRRLLSAVFLRNAHQMFRYMMENCKAIKHNFSSIFFLLTVYNVGVGNKKWSRYCARKWQKY